MSDTGLSIKSVDFNVFALEDKARREGELQAFLDDKDKFQQGPNKDWDYTHNVWGTTPDRDKSKWSAMLLDPGAAKIISFMGLYADHEDPVVTRDREAGQMDVFMKTNFKTILPILFINPRTGDPVEIHPTVYQGIGGCTTQEKSRRVKWENYTGRGLMADGGYTKESLETMKMSLMKSDPDRIIKDDPDIKKCIFFMPDPNAEGGYNTLVKMSAKRSEGDGVMAIPGVAQRFTQQLDLTDTTLDEAGNRVPVTPKPVEISTPVVDNSKRDKLIEDMRYEFPEYTAGTLLAEAKKLMAESNGLYTSQESALKVLWKQLKEPKPEKPAEKPVEKPIEPEKPKEAPEPEQESSSEQISSKDGTVLGTLRVLGKNLTFTPAMEFTEDTPPFKSFLLERVLDKMAETDKGRVESGEIEEREVLDYDVTLDSKVITFIEIYNYGGERRLREIHSSLRWTLDKMYDKMKETPSEPSFTKASGEMVMCSEELQARGAVGSMLGSDQLDYKVVEGELWVSPMKFLGDSWGSINDALRGLGGMWIKVKPTHWALPVKVKKPLPVVVGLETEEVENIISQLQAAYPNISRAMILEKMDTEVAKAAGLLNRIAAAHLVASNYSMKIDGGDLCVEMVENQLTELHGELAMQRLAVTENSSFIMVEPYQTLTVEEQKAFNKSLKGLGAEYRGDGDGWYLKKPVGGD